MWVDQIEDVADVATNYFEDIFKASTCDRLEECLNAVPHKMNSDMQEVLTNGFSAKEIKAALFKWDQPRLLDLMV